MLSDTPCMDKAGANVQLTITSLWLKLSDLDSGQVRIVHALTVGSKINHYIQNYVYQMQQTL